MPNVAPWHHHLVAPLLARLSYDRWTPERAVMDNLSFAPLRLHVATTLGLVERRPRMFRMGWKVRLALGAADRILEGSRLDAPRN